MLPTLTQIEFPSCIQRCEEQRTTTLASLQVPIRPIIALDAILSQDKKIYATFEGFLHCFREPWKHISPGDTSVRSALHANRHAHISQDSTGFPVFKAFSFFPAGIPRLMLSQSDFVNPDSSDLKPRGLAKEYLFAYSNLVCTSTSRGSTNFPVCFLFEFNSKIIVQRQIGSHRPVIGTTGIETGH